MKAKDIAKIQVCTNTGVAKGTIGTGKVLDINMAMPADTVKGFVEAQGGFGKTMEGNGTVNVLYGSARTDLYANASYRYQQGHKEYVSLHMTNRFDNRNKLLTYLTQQYIAMPEGHSQKIMGRARYFHTFNDKGTELLVLGGYHLRAQPMDQIKLGYYRKYYNPALEWENPKGLLHERDINQIKLAYAYSTRRLTIQPEASFYIVEGEENFGELAASAYWKTKWITLTGGANLHVAKSIVFASVRCAPTAYLPRQWQIGLQVVYFTPNSPVRVLYGTPVYGCLSVNKQIGTFLNLAVEWHDMFDSFCPDAKVNRHAANIKVQYRF